MEKRYTCKFCGRKRNQTELTKIQSDIFKKEVWICREHASKISDVTSIRETQKKPVFLEIFSGSKHISEYAESLGFEVHNIDFEKKYNPTICGDITKIKLGDLPPVVNVAWCSVPCYVYSVMSLAKHWEKISIGHRNYYYIPKSSDAIQALRILNKTLRIIAQLNPQYYFIENPRGALRHMPQMKLVPYRHTVSYADYGFDYYKPTDIWTNCESFKPKPITGCVGRKFSSSIVDLPGSYERSLIPPGLIEEVFNSFKNKFSGL
jgi:hypothetical protein